MFKIASELGGLALKDESGNKLDLLDECLITSKLCEAMKADDKVNVNYIFCITIINLRLFIRYNRH